MEESINIKHILFLMRKNRILIIAAILFFATLFFVISNFFITEQYTTQVSLYVYNSVITASERIQSGDLSASMLIAQDCLVLFKEPSFLIELSSRLNGRISPSSLYSAISVTTIVNTRIVKVAVRTPNAQLSADVCSELVVLADEVVKLTVGDAASAKNTSSRPPMPATSPSAPNVKRHTLLGALLGAALSLGLIVIALFLDNTIKDEDDLRMRIDVPVLGEIPTMQTKSKRRERKND